MTSISKNDVTHIASLARIHLKEEEIASLQNDLGNILTYVKSLESLDLRDTQPTSHALTVQNVYREDKVIPPLGQKTAMKIAVEGQDGFFKVPKVIG